MSEDTYRYYSDDHRRHIDVKAPVHTLIQNTTVHNHIDNAVGAPVEKGDVSAVVLKPKGARRGAVRVGKKQVAAIKEFRKRKDVTQAENEVTNETVVFLQPKRGAFDAEGRNWSFHKGKEIITANIKDEAFLDHYRKGEFRLHHTDILKVKLVEHQKIKSGKLQTTYDITEVLDYTPGEFQARLKAHNE
jgi:hypothetical protein